MQKTKKKNHAIDPVCGLEVFVKADTPKHEYKNKPYYFCCNKCKEDYIENPEAYTETE